VNNTEQEIADLIKNVRKLELVARKNVSGFFGGNYLTSIRGRGMMFHEARKYVLGESIRMIDWNITARMNEPYVKTYLDEREREVFIALDVSPSMYSGWQDRTKLEFAIEVAATLAVSAVESKDKLGFLTFADRIFEIKEPVRGKGQLFHALKTFLKYTHMPPVKCSVSDPRAAIHGIQRFRGKRFVIFIISDFIDRDVPDDLKYIQARHDVSLIHIYDPVEYEKTDKVFFPAFSLEGKGSLKSVSPGDCGSLEEIQKFMDEQSEAYRLMTASISTRSPVGRALMDFFHKKRVRFK